MVRNKLTAGAIAELGPGNHPDGGNLYLRVVGGSRTYSFRYTRGGKSHWLTLGTAENWSLAEARKRARAYRRRLDDGADLAGEVKAARTPPPAKETFGKVAADYIEAQRPSWKSKVHAAQWTATLEQHATPLMTMPVDQITTDDIFAVLAPLWTTKTETATRLRGRIEKILDAATVKGQRSGPNPARWRGHLDSLLAKRSKVAKVEHHAALPWKLLPAVMERLSASSGTGARCVQFIALTAARSGEARGATWAEIDLDKNVWTIPAARMKAGVEHRVPLSAPALKILAEMKPLRGKGDLIFPGGSVGRPLSDVAVSKALHAAAGTTETTVHGLRSTFRDWCSEATSTPGAVAEAALAHGIRDKTEKAYARSDLLEQRRVVMEAWAAHCGIRGESAAVTK